MIRVKKQIASCRRQLTEFKRVQRATICPVSTDAGSILCNPFSFPGLYTVALARKKELIASVIITINKTIYTFLPFKFFAIFIFKIYCTIKIDKYQLTICSKPHTIHVFCIFYYKMPTPSTYVPAITQHINYGKKPDDIVNVIPFTNEHRHTIRFFFHLSLFLNIVTARSLSRKPP